MLPDHWTNVAAQEASSSAATMVAPVFENEAQAVALNDSASDSSSDDSDFSGDDTTAQFAAELAQVMELSHEISNLILSDQNQILVRQNQISCMFCF